MDNKVFCKIILFISFLMPLMLTGCSAQPQSLVAFDQLSDCPQQSSSTLIADQELLGPLSNNTTLACALTTIRDSSDPSLRRTSLGSRICMNLAEREVDQVKREKLAEEGIKLAKEALSLSGDGDGSIHYYLAANLGIAMREHITLAIENLNRLETEAKKALALSPNLDDGGPLRLLGALYLKAPAWPNGIGDQEKALELLKKAVNKHPEHPLNHLFYAQALWNEEDKTNLSTVKAELMQGKKLLAAAKWRYYKAPWGKEFDDFQSELTDN